MSDSFRPVIPNIIDDSMRSEDVCEPVTENVPEAGGDPYNRKVIIGVVITIVVILVMLIIYQLVFRVTKAYDPQQPPHPPQQQQQQQQQPPPPQQQQQPQKKKQTSNMDNIDDELIKKYIKKPTDKPKDVHINIKDEEDEDEQIEEIEADDDDDDHNSPMIEEIVDQLDNINCDFKLVKGANKGKDCGRKATKDGRCATHLDKLLV
jgi:hypothetical protein